MSKFPKYSPETHPGFAQKIEPLLKNLTPQELALLSIEGRREALRVFTERDRSTLFVAVTKFFCGLDEDGRPGPAIKTMHGDMPDQTYSRTSGVYLVRDASDFLIGVDIHTRNRDRYGQLISDLLVKGIRSTDQSLALASVNDGEYVYAAALNTVVPGLAGLCLPVVARDPELANARFGINSIGEVEATPDPKHLLHVLRREI